MLICILCLQDSDSRIFLLAMYSDHALPLICEVSMWRVQGSCSKWKVKGSCSKCTVQGSCIKWRVKGSCNRWRVQGSCGGVCVGSCNIILVYCHCLCIFNAYPHCAYI